MQPYLLPYLGYFQLISAVDTFVIYDDVQWMKGGWINRNRMLFGGRPEWFTLSVKKDPLGTFISATEFSEKFDEEKQSILAKMHAAYRAAPFVGPTMKLVESCFASADNNAAAFISRALKKCCEYLDLHTEILLSSELDKSEGLRGQDRVIDISATLGASEYVNAIGGTHLYDREAFAERGLRLSFVQSEPISYPQLGAEFVPDLSIIDVLMFNSVESVVKLMNEYELV